MFARNKDLLQAIELIEEIEQASVDNRVNHECFEASTSEALSKIKLAIKEATGNFEIIQEKHNSFVNKVAVSIEELKEQVELLDTKCQNLDKWDDQTRGKFAALENHLGIDLVAPNPSDWTVEQREGEE